MQHSLLSTLKIFLQIFVKLSLCKCDFLLLQSIQSKSVKCCWVCVACKENQFLEDEFTCMDCALGWWPNENLTGMYIHFITILLPFLCFINCHIKIQLVLA